MIENCSLCNLHKSRKKIITPTSNSECSGVIITDCPTKREDMTGKLTDTYWKVVEKVFTLFNSDIKNYYTTAAIKCCPEINRHPTIDELKACSKWLFQEISQIKPKVILFFGDQTIKAYSPIQENLINRILTTRLSKVTIVTHNPKGLIEGTDKFLEFKNAVRKFISQSRL